MNWVFKAVVIGCGVFGCVLGQGGGFSSYPPVNVDDLNPLTINWNQVHYLVRQNLLEIDELKQEHEDIYKELQKCVGLEKCLGESGLINMNVEGNQASFVAGSFLAELQREREALRGTGLKLEAEMREKKRQIEWQKRQNWENQRRQQQSSSSQSQSYRYGQEANSKQQQQNTYRSSSSSSETRNQGGPGRAGGTSTSYQRTYTYEYSGSNRQQQPPTQHGRQSYSYERTYNYGRRGGYDTSDNGPIPGRG